MPALRRCLDRMAPAEGWDRSRHCSTHRRSPCARTRFGWWSTSPYRTPSAYCNGCGTRLSNTATYGGPCRPLCGTASTTTGRGPSSPMPSQLHRRRRPFSTSHRSAYHLTAPGTVGAPAARRGGHDRKRCGGPLSARRSRSLGPVRTRQRHSDADGDRRGPRPHWTVAGGGAGARAGCRNPRGRGVTRGACSAAARPGRNQCGHRRGRGPRPTGPPADGNADAHGVPSRARPLRAAGTTRTPCRRPPRGRRDPRSRRRPRSGGGVVGERSGHGPSPPRRRRRHRHSRLAQRTL